MEDKSGPDLASQMKEARDLLDEGEVRDALVLALDVLWRELDQLRGTIGAIHQTLPPPQAGATAVEPARFEFIWTEPISYLLH